MARRAAVLDLDAVLAGVLAGRDPTARAAGPGRAGVGPDPGATRSGAAPVEPGPDPDAEAMMDATSQLLGSFGLRRWSMDDVAERAGLARATVYRRFESRDRLVRATLVRDARRFFSAIAAAVDSSAPIEDQVLDGFVVGIGLARLSPVPRLLEADPAAALALVSSDSILQAGRRALVESYEAVNGRPVPAADRLRVEAVAEALIRLALSLLVTPGILTGGTGSPPPGPDMRRALAAVIRPLVAPPTVPTGPAG